MFTLGSFNDTRDIRSIDVNLGIMFPVEQNMQDILIFKSANTDVHVFEWSVGTSSYQLSGNVTIAFTQLSILRSAGNGEFVFTYSIPKDTDLNQRFIEMFQKSGGTWSKIKDLSIWGGSGVPLHGWAGLSLSPDGTTLVSTSDSVPSYSCTIRVYDSPSFDVVQEFVPFVDLGGEIDEFATLNAKADNNGIYFQAINLNTTQQGVYLYEPVGSPGAIWQHTHTFSDPVNDISLLDINLDLNLCLLKKGQYDIQRRTGGVWALEQSIPPLGDGWVLQDARIFDANNLTLMWYKPSQEYRVQSFYFNGSTWDVIYDKTITTANAPFYIHRPSTYIEAPHFLTTWYNSPNSGYGTFGKYEILP